MTEPEKMALTSMDVAGEKREELRRCLASAFPEVFAEGAIDFDQLKRVLGEWVDPGKERFGLNWPGKAECMKIIQQPSVATLRPVRKESVDFGETENLFIEGDNLEVLKLLQKAYFGKVKMIYIDPPYNTGNEFIYPDKYAETLDTYLAYTGQRDEEGRKFSTNTDASGRYHSRWLSMMYPRLYLSKNLLRDDGCIFISIDDVELAHLRSICDEIFGAEHFGGLISRSTGTRMGSGSSTLSSELDYILVYAKTDEVEFPGLPMTEDDLSIYDQEDERGKYLTRSLRRTGGENRREDRPSMFYPVTAPDGTKVFPIAPAGYESRWVCGKATYDKLVADGMIEWKKMKKNGAEQWQVYQKHYVGSALKQPSNLWNDEEGNKKATRDLNAIFDGLKVFDHPKPVGLMQRLLTLATEPKGEHIVLDFFAGSGTLGQAVWLQNQLDDGNRRFILVQLPEKLDESIKAQQVALQFCEKLGVPATVAELCKERLRRSAAMIKSRGAGELSLNPDAQGVGFSAFRLDASNFRLWDGDAGDNADLPDQLEMHADHIATGGTSEDILYELLLKAGFPLATKVQTVEMAGKSVFCIEDGSLLICLDREITSELIDALAEANPLQVICLDEGFKGNDQLKANAVQTFRARAEAEESEIVFKTI